MTLVLLSPLLWLSIVQVCLVGSLYVVGYLSLPETDKAVNDLRELLAEAPDMAAHRAGLAYSGVTLGLTAALAITSGAWAVSAFLGRGPAFPMGSPGRYRCWVLGAVIALSTALYAMLRTTWWGRPLQPFPSALGERLLEAAYKPAWASDSSGASLGGQVPEMMFLLSILVPATLAAGASFLQQPIAQATPHRERLVALRLRELDHLLYIGALALVFGTLQLSATMSIPLASVPKAGDLKNRLDLCKTLAPVPASSSVVGWSGSSPDAEFAVQECRKLPKAFALDESANGLRQLVRSVTLALGLAFSAMLVAIYVPAMVGLRMMIDPVMGELPSSAGEAAPGNAPSLGDVDPLHRIATVAATLGPFIAGLLANALGSS